MWGNSNTIPCTISMVQKFQEWQGCIRLGTLAQPEILQSGLDWNVHEEGRILEKEKYWGREGNPGRKPVDWALNKGFWWSRWPTVKSRLSSVELRRPLYSEGQANARAENHIEKGLTNFRWICPCCSQTGVLVTCPLVAETNHDDKSNLRKERFILLAFSF